MTRLPYPPTCAHAHPAAGDPPSSSPKEHRLRGQAAPAQIPALPSPSQENRGKSLTPSVPDSHPVPMGRNHNHNASTLRSRDWHRLREAVRGLPTCPLHYFPLKVALAPPQGPFQCDLTLSTSPAPSVLTPRITARRLSPVLQVRSVDLDPLDRNGGSVDAGSIHIQVSLRIPTGPADRAAQPAVVQKPSNKPKNAFLPERRETAPRRPPNRGRLFTRVVTLIKIKLRHRAEPAGVEPAQLKGWSLNLACAAESKSDVDSVQ